MNVVSVLLSSQQQHESVDPKRIGDCVITELPLYYCPTAAFLKLWSADHKWSSGSALVVLLD